jgi:rhodanese-related sulfurtransferase
MDTTKPTSTTSSASRYASPFVCTPDVLFSRILSNEAPLVIDVRKNVPYLASYYTLPGAMRRDPLQVGVWAGTLPAVASVVVYCVYGHEVSMNTMWALRARGINASFMEGGVEAWREQGLPLATKASQHHTRWVTRARPKIDRIACPWLVKRFVDADAEFLYVPTEQVRQTAECQSATAYDVGPNVADTVFTHDDDLCSFDAFIKHYRLGQDTALARLAMIVRAADTDRLDLAPQAAGLLSISLGMSRSHSDDHAMLAAMLPVYDALYTWCRDAVAGQDEQHNWKPA